MYSLGVESHDCGVLLKVIEGLGILGADEVSFGAFVRRILIPSSFVSG